MSRPIGSRPALLAIPLALALGLALVGCGPPSPQAPPPYASKLKTATSGISGACGKAARVTAFPGDHGGALHAIEASAASSAHTLASVYHRDPSWIYFGKTVRQIVRESLSLLGSCGLHEAQHQLARATRHR